MDADRDEAVFQTDPPVDADTLSYFPPTTSSAFPVASTHTTSSIFTKLLQQAEVDASLYPPRSWEGLRQLVQAIEESDFETLRRNSLIYYLLLDYHLLPLNASSTSSSGRLSLAALRQPPRILDHFTSRRLLPAFWANTIAKGFWRFDKSLYAEAMPWLNNANSSAYSNHILHTLSPLTSNRNGLSPREAAQCVVKHLRIAKPSLPAVPDGPEDVEALKSIIVAKAIAEDLRSSLLFVHALSAPQQQLRELLSVLWSWIFALEDRTMQGPLLKAIIALPLSPLDSASLTDFALGLDTPTSSASARSLALDTLLVRLINLGRVIEALDVNAQAEERAGLLVERQDVKKKRKRREMLQVAKAMLPEVVRSQLERVSLDSSNTTGDSPDGPMDEDFDVTQQSLIASKRRLDVDQMAKSSTLGRGYLQGRGETSRAAIGSSPASRHLAGARSTPLPSQSPFAHSASPMVGPTHQSPVPRAPTSTTFTGRAGTTTDQSPHVADTSLEAGPYARLAAQMRADPSMDPSADDMSIISSLLPQKRSSSAIGKATTSGNDDGDDNDDDEISRPTVGRSNTMASGFEVPKRRYAKKDNAPSTSKAGSSKKSKTLPTAKTTTGTPQRVAAGERSQETAEVKAATSTKSRGRNAPASSTATTATPRRRTRASSALPGTFPDGGAEDGDDQDMSDEEVGPRQNREDEAGPEMREVGSSRATTSGKGRASAVAATAASTPAKKKGTSATPSSRRKTSSTPAKGKDQQNVSESTPLRRSARARSRGASVLSSQMHDSDNEEEQQASLGRGRMTRSKSRSNSVFSMSSSASAVDEEEDEEAGQTTGDETARHVPISTRRARKAN